MAATMSLGALLLRQHARVTRGGKVGRMSMAIAMERGVKRQEYLLYGTIFGVCLAVTNDLLYRMHFKVLRAGTVRH